MSGWFLDMKYQTCSASIQHVNNVGMMLVCDECEMWRLQYSKRKLKAIDCHLEQKLDGISVTCGSSLQDLADLSRSAASLE